MIFLHYELLENLQNHILDIPGGTPEKKVWWYLACYNAPKGALSCISISPSTLV